MVTLGLGSERRRWRREAERSRRGPGPRQETARREVAISEAKQSNNGLFQGTHLSKCYTVIYIVWQEV